MTPKVWTREEGEIRLATWESWKRWIEHADRVIKASDWPAGGRLVTLFVGVDHGAEFDSDEAPLLFETTVRGGPDHGVSMRSSSEDDAVADHDSLLKRAKPEDDG